MANHQRKTNKRHDKRSGITPQKTTTTSTAKNIVNLRGASAASAPQGQETAVPNQKLIVRDVKRTGLLTAIIVIIIVVLAFVLPHLSS